MKRLLIALSVTLLATTAFAFDASKSVVRIGVLQGTFEGESRLGHALIDELRGRGFDAFDAGRTYDELLDEEAVPIADYVIEIRGGDAHTVDHGGVGISTAHADVELGVISSNMRAELRVYDGDTMELVGKSDLSKRTTALMPTGVGVGTRAIFAYIALPMIERAQHRSVAKKVAREAASFVTATVRGE